MVATLIVSELFQECVMVFFLFAKYSMYDNHFCVYCIRIVEQSKLINLRVCRDIYQTENAQEHDWDGPLATK